MNLGKGIPHQSSFTQGVGGSPQISASSKKGYENVILPEGLGSGSPVPQYEEVEGEILEGSVPGPTRGRMASITSSNLSEPLSPSPPLPDRKYLDTDIIQSPPPPEVPERRYTLASGTTPQPAEQACLSPREKVSRKISSDSLHHTPMHQLSDMGNEYAVISRNNQVEVGVTPEETDPHPPNLPLRAHQRMSSREDILADTAEEGGGANVGPEVTAISKYADLRIGSNHTPSSAPKEGYQSSLAYSVVKLDSQTGKLEIKKEDELPYPTSPQPYEVASPVPGSTPHHELNTTDPHYEEIESKDEVSGELLNM